MLTGISNSFLNKTISLLLAMVELVGAGCFAVPWPGSSLRGGKQQRHGPSRTPGEGEGQEMPKAGRGPGMPEDCPGLKAGLSSAALSSSVLLLCSDPAGPQLQPPLLPGACWLCVTPPAPHDVFLGVLPWGFGDVKTN